MAHSSLAKLLILHDRDQRFSQVKAQLKQWPLDRQNTERDIAAENARIAAAEEKIKELELRRKELEGQVAAAEEKVVKYRTQQLSVKKQEEYAALENEITTLRETIDDWETEELDVLDAIDHAQAALAQTRERAAAAIATLEAHLRTIDEGLAENKNAVGDAEAQLKAARADLKDAPDALAQYDFVRKQVKRFPIMVELIDGKCRGCHLRVSGEVESEARKGTAIVRCSSCGRIVYID